MGLLSLGWFKSQKEKEKEDLELKAAKLQVEILEKKKEGMSLKALPPHQIYKKLKLVDTVLTVVLNSGEILSKTNASREDFERVKSASSEVEIYNLLPGADELKEQQKKALELEKHQNILKGAEILKNHRDFEEKEGSIYLLGENGVIPRSIPALLVEKFAEVIGKLEDDEEAEVEFQALKKFWLKCCMNPSAKSAEALYNFLSNNNMKIDNHGNFYAYRRVISRGVENSALVEFVSNTYTKVKGVWKKNACNYDVFKKEDGDTAKYRFASVGKFLAPSDDPGIWDRVGNLKELYLNLPNMKENSYTDQYTQTYDYKVGEVISMPRQEGDDNSNVACSRGFHAANHKLYDYSYYGDTVVLMIINPQDVLAVPEAGKLRTCRWFFASVLGHEEQDILDDVDFDVAELGDIFEAKCAENLQEYVKNSFAEEVKRHTFEMPTISASELSNIVTTLDDMREAIKDRIVEF